MPKNLITTENAKEMGSKGGKKSVEVRRRKREAREAILLWGEKPIKKGKVMDLDDIDTYESSVKKNMTAMDATWRKLWLDAINGNPNAVAKIFDVLGITAKSEVKVEVKDTESLRSLKAALAKNPDALDEIINDSETD